MTAPAAATAARGEMLVAFFSTLTNSTVAAPNGMSERSEPALTSGSYKLTSEVAGRLQPASGDSGARTATASKSGPWIRQLIAIRPAN